MRPFASITYGQTARKAGAPVSVAFDSDHALVLYRTAHYLIPRAAIAHCLRDGPEVSRVVFSLVARQ